LFSTQKEHLNDLNAKVEDLKVLNRKLNAENSSLWLQVCVNVLELSAEISLYFMMWFWI